MRQISIRLALSLCLGAALLLSGLPLAAIGEVTPTPPGIEIVPSATPTPLPPPPTAAPSNPSPLNPGPSDIDEQLNEAVRAIQAGETDRAINILNGVISQDPQNGEAYLIRGIANLQGGNTLRAIDDFSRTIDIIPSSSSAYVFRGDALIAAGDAEAALADYNYALFLNPRDIQAYIGRGTLYNQQGETTLAQIDGQIAQGLTSLNIGNVEAAQRLFSQAIDQSTANDTPSAEAYYNRGLSYLTAANEVAAASDLSNALEIDAQMHDAYLARGIAERLLGNAQAAGRDFQRRIELLERRSAVESITRNQPLDIVMAYGVVYRIQFEAMGGDVVTITARDRDGVFVDPLIALIDPSGIALTGDDDFGGDLDSLIESYRIPADGTYTILVSHANGGFDGPVRVELR